jgi:hypothetical protein
VAIKIIYDGKSPSYTTRVIDTKTGENIEGIYRVEIILDVNHVPMAKLFICEPELEIEIPEN